MWSDRVGLALQGSDVLVLSQRSLSLSWEIDTVCTKATSMLTLLGDFSKAKCSVSQTVTFCKALDMILCFLCKALEEICFISECLSLPAKHSV